MAKRTRVRARRPRTTAREIRKRPPKGEFHHAAMFTRRNCSLTPAIASSIHDASLADIAVDLGSTKARWAIWQSVRVGCVTCHRRANSRHRCGCWRRQRRLPFSRS